MTPATSQLSRSRAAALAMALFALPALAAAEARADDGVGQQSAPEIAAREARAAVEQQRYQEALEKARALLALGRGQESASPRWRAQALEIMAVVYLIEGRAAEARAPLAELYALAPGFVLDDPALPPRVTEAFEAEAKRPHARSVQIELLSAEEGAIELAAGGATTKVSLECRSEGSADFASLIGTKIGGRYRFPLSAPRAHQCFAVAFDADDLPLGRLGSRVDPFEVRSPRSSPPPAAAAPQRTQSTGLPKNTKPLAPPLPITSTWWFWTGLTAVVAAGVTVTVIAARPSEPAAPFADVTATAKAAVWTW